MDYPHIASLLFGKPLWVASPYAEIVAGILSARLGMDASHDPPPLPAHRDAYDPSMRDGILTIPIVGSLRHRGNAPGQSSSGTNYMHLQNVMQSAEADPDVRGILLEIDSPGGMATGNLELAATIAAVNKTKPVWAIANGTAASAAYAIASSAGRVIAMPSGEVGSIGVIVMHQDVSGVLEKRGIKVTFIHAGSMKTAFNAFEPLPEAVKAEVQAAVDASYARFVGHVAAQRGSRLTAESVRATEARMYDAEPALALGLIDHIATYEDTRREFAQQVKPRRVYVMATSDTSRII